MPILAFDESHMRNFDPQNPGDLYSIWSVFSKASTAIQDGKRLENLSWRLLNRETVRTSKSSTDLGRLPSHSNPLQSHPPVPELSTSVDSRSSGGSHAITESPAPTSNTFSSHGALDNGLQPKERRMTPSELHHLMYSIRVKQELNKPVHPLRSNPIGPNNHIGTQQPTHIPSQPTNVDSSTSTVATAMDSFNSVESNSDTSVSSAGSVPSHSIVRGFTPGKDGITSYTSKSQLAPAPTPILNTSKQQEAEASKDRKSGMFLLGGSSGEDECSLQNHMSPGSMAKSNEPTKQASFHDTALVMRQKEAEEPPKTPAVFDDSDDEDEDDSDIEEVSESAIDDDDDAWEDDSDEPPKPEEKEIQFYRVDSSANLTSRRSALTLNLQQEQRSGTNLAKQASNSTPALRRTRNTTPNGPSVPASPDEDSILHKRGEQMKTSKPVTKVTTDHMNPIPAAFSSPRTTKRNMLTGELSESLRKNMLHERSQKNNFSVNGPIRRAHTAMDVSNLSRLPEEPDTITSGNVSTSNPAGALQEGGGDLPWNHYFENSTGEYHQAGW
ncbi:MAG: hypothetical protein M1831_004122 [Alyxoria varia]|nr:MAG: hypothetical protein M1831_004122 [Alyxoria varia]